jgi:hypothetical protein
VYDFITCVILQNHATCCISLDDVKDEYELKTSSMRRDCRQAKRARAGNSTINSISKIAFRCHFGEL